MKSRFFPKRDEVVLSTMTALLVGVLVYHGCVSLTSGKEHSLFQKNSTVVTKK